MEEKIPPQDLEAEQSALGSLMLSKEAIALVVSRLRPEYFYRDAHGHIFYAIRALYQRNEPVDLVTVSAELKKLNKLEEVGGRAYIAEIVDTVPTASNVEKYTNIVIEKALLRKLIDTGSHIISDAFDDSQEVEQVLEEAQKQIMEISREGVTADFVKLEDVLKDVFDNIQNTYNNEDRILGVPSGLSDLDAMTSGFQAGDLVILAARPSVGKTTLALNFAAHAAIEKKIPVAIFSIEMPKDALAMRMLCSEAKIDSKRLRTANLLDHEYKNLNYAFGKLGEAPIYIDDTPGLTSLELRSKCRRLQMEADIKLIVIDYLQLMRSGKKRVESRFQEVSEIVREIKGFSKETGIPIIALSQLSRDIEKRAKEDRRPQLSDLRESGEIEQTADLVMFIHRDDYYANGSEDENPAFKEAVQSSVSVVDLIISKQRNGPTGSVRLMFNKAISRFDMAESKVHMPS